MAEIAKERQFLLYQLHFHSLPNVKLLIFLIEPFTFCYQSLPKDLCL